MILHQEDIHFGNVSTVPFLRSYGIRQRWKTSEAVHAAFSGVLCPVPLLRGANLSRDRAREILDLGCGTRKREGAIGVDKIPSVADILHDLDCFPYPFEDSSFDEIHLDNVLEHLAERQSGHWKNSTGSENLAG